MLFSSVIRENITWKLIKLGQKIIFQYLFQNNIIIQLYIFWCGQKFTVDYIISTTATSTAQAGKAWSRSHCHI